MRAKTGGGTRGINTVTVGSTQCLSLTAPPSFRAF